MYYIEEKDGEVINWFYTNDGREGTVIEKEEYLKLKNRNDFIYKYVDGLITVKARPIKLEDAKKTALEELSKETKASILAGFTFEGDVYKCDEQDQLNYTGLRSVSSNGYFTDNGITEITFTLKDGTNKQVSVTKIKALTDACFGHVLACRMAGKAKKEAIMACTSLTQLKAL